MTGAASHAIPLVLVEEHHEAFYVWNYAALKGWIPSANNTLLHADSHADMALPRLRQPLCSVADLTDLLDFVHRELDISSFIWPAVYAGMFNRVLWLKPQHRTSSGGWRPILVSSKNERHTEFLLTSFDATQPQTCPPGARLMHFCPVTPQEYLATEQPIVLDIDLDYFCCNEYPLASFREVEITHQSFDEFQANPYHVLRMSPAMKVSAIRRAGRYYLLFYDYQADGHGRTKGNSDFRATLSSFCRYLACYSVAPPLIVVCRSMYSGYTPAEHVEDLQREVLEGLGHLYSLRVMTLNEIASCEPTGAAQPDGSEPVRLWHKTAA
jgi:hypothetical protein